MKLSAEQHQKNLEHLATLTPEMMEGMTVAYLRKLLAGVNIANISRDGELVNTTRARKPEIIAAIYEMTTKPRVLAQVELTELSTDDIKAGLTGLLHSTDESLSTYAQKTFEDLRDYTLGQWDAEHERWKLDTQYPMTLSLGLFVWLESYRTVEGHELNGPTKVVYASRIRNSVKKLIKTLEANSIYLPQLLRHYEQLKVHNHKLFNELTSEKRTEQKERATFRQGNSQAIDPTMLLEQARLTLGKVVKGESVRWHDVSIALVLCTGRRPSEIHATASFTYVDDNHVEFTGQLKKKDISTQGYIIPTLAPSQDCIAALEFLKRNGKYHLGEPEKAHKRVSSEISKYGIKAWFDKCLPNVEDYTDDNGKVFKVRTHYRMREIYTLISLDLFEKSTDRHSGRDDSGKPRHLSASDKVRYIASILVHEDNSKAYEAYDANFYLQY
jgi:hypothetical protein